SDRADPASAPGAEAGNPAAGPEAAGESVAVVGVPAWSFAMSEVAEQPIPAGPPETPPPPPALPETPALAPPAPLSRWAGQPAAPQLASNGLPVPSLGPVGRRRHPGAVALLSVVTLGIYSIGWHARVNREMSEFDARLEVSPGASALGVAIAWLVGIASSLTGAALLLGHLLRIGPSLMVAVDGVTVMGRFVRWDYLMLGGILVVPYLALVLPFSVIAVVMTLERVREIQERVGIRSDRQIRPVRHACLLLVPIAGGLWHLAVVQSRLNQVWQRSASPLGNRPSRR
ncbi:MAG: DUF4234 domain-containing protein, partial [Candidatus Dormiibacterota bacterium]